MKKTSLLALALFGLSTSFAGANAVAISAIHETNSVGFGQGANKKQAGKAAQQSCAKSNKGKACGYYYWTKDTSHMVMVRCQYSLGSKAEGEHAVQGGHSSASLIQAKAAAYKKLSKKLQYLGLRANDKNCKVIASYSNGKFNDQISN